MPHSNTSSTVYCTVLCQFMPPCAMLCYLVSRHAMLDMLHWFMLCYSMPWGCRVPWGEALLSLEPAREEHDPTTGQVLTRGLSARVGIFHGPITRLCLHAVTGQLLPLPICCSKCFWGVSSRLLRLCLLCWCFCCCCSFNITACGRLGILVLYGWPCPRVWECFIYVFT